MKISAEILNIGDEILIGQIMNTNSVWIARQLNAIGMPVEKMTTVGDTEEAITEALDKALAAAQVVIITGGLGPTKDDITKATLCKYFQTGLKFHEDIFEMLAAWFKVRNREISEANRSQANLPECCIPLMNHWGTAPGMMFEHEGKLIFSLPGVPFEMKELMKKYVLPAIAEKFQLPPLVHRSFQTQGIPESELMVTIREWEDHLPSSLKLAYLPSAGAVKLRLSSLNEAGDAETLIDAEEKKLRAILGQEIFGYEADSLESVIGELLKQQGKMLATAESCTGGYMAHRLTTVPGISAVYKGSVIAYDNAVKTQLLGVDEKIIEAHGVVSQPVVELMAANLATLMNVDYTIAASGVAGPGGGTDEKPVGTVWVAWKTPEGLFSKKFLFGNDRMENIQRTHQYALNILRKFILKVPVKGLAGKEARGIKG